jgi:acetylglutamate kinase
LTDSPEEAGWVTAKTLAEALPYIQIHDRQTVVIKYGGHAMGEEALARLFAADAVLLRLLGVRPVVVHGGGPQISRMLERAGVKSTFVDGLRVTDKATMEVAEMVLSGAINKEIASWITQAGATADVRGVGLSGKDAGLIWVEKATRTRPAADIGGEDEVVDLGSVARRPQADPHPDRL